MPWWITDHVTVMLPASLVDVARRARATGARRGGTEARPGTSGRTTGAARTPYYYYVLPAGHYRCHSVNATLAVPEAERRADDVGLPARGGGRPRDDVRRTARTAHHTHWMGAQRSNLRRV